MLLWCLIWCLSCLHSYHDISLLKVHVSMLLDTSFIVVLIVAQYLSTLASSIEVFWVFLNTFQHIARSIELNFWTLCLLDTYLDTLKLLATDTSLTPLDTSSFYSQHLLDTCSICRDAYFIYTRGSTWFFSNSNISILLSSLFSFDPILILSPKLFSSSFWHFFSSNLLVSGLNPFFSSSFTHFIHSRLRHLNFLGKFRDFVFLLKILGGCRYRILYPLWLGPPFPNDDEILRPKVGLGPNQMLNWLEKC